MKTKNTLIIIGIFTSITGFFLLMHELIKEKKARIDRYYKSLEIRRHKYVSDANRILNKR